MKGAIVQSTETVALVGPAEVSDELLNDSLTLCPVVVAADGGARRALNAGRMPDAVIGDLDSLDAETAKRLPPDRLHRIAEQDSTDFEKALRHISAPLILAVGFTGRRLDHELAVYNSLVRHADRPAIVVGEHDICCHVTGTLRLALPAGTRVSLFPMGPVTGRSTGLRWAIDGVAFAPWGRIGTSNEATGKAVAIHTDGPGMLAILPRAAGLRPLMRALAGG